MTDRDALAREMAEATGLGINQFPVPTMARIAMWHIAIARAEALEEAALICQGRANGYSIYDTQMEAAQEAIICRNLIRALVEPPA